MYPPTQAPPNSNPQVIKTGDALEERNDEEYKDPLDGREDLQKALMDILHDFDILEEPNRNYRIRIWKKCENYWHHLQNIYWSANANDWKSPEFFRTQFPDADVTETEMKIVNIYRSHGESIVAALSVGTPTVRYFPEDADNPSDVTTSRAYSKIAKMIERQNKAKLLLMRMIYILFNQGMVAVHNYSHESKEYGTRQVPKYGKQEANYAKTLCSSCGETLSEHGPDLDEPIKLDNTTPVQCPTCGDENIPQVEHETRQDDYIKGYDEKPKCRQRITAYGPLNIKISSYAYDQKSVGILVFDSEQTYPKAQEMYPNIADKMRTGPLASDVSVQARIPNSVQDAYNRSNVTVRQVWMRPWQFNAYTKTGNPKDDQIVKDLKEIFPDGCVLHAVNDTYAESEKENLDKAWSLSFNPCDRFIQSDPVGLGLIPIQDMKNMVVNLSVESLEYGVPETFVDPEVLDFDAYKEAKGGPGMVFPIKPQIPGADIGKSFYQNKTATLTDETGRLESRIDADGQFVSGDYPSIYGGPVSGIGDTAAAYSMSRQQALQRLSTIWTIVSFLWADVMKNSAEGFIANLKEDEHYVQENGDDYINIWIRKSETDGNIGDVYPESSEQFPIGWAQQREILMQLLQMQNPMLESVISDPNNRTEISTLLGLPNLYIPGDQDRRKQLNEISLLLQSDANIPEVDPNNPQQQEMPPQTTIQPEKIDDHLVHIQTCKHWLNSEVGQYFKEQKPGKYMNVMLHMEQHELMMMQSTMQMNPNSQPGENDPSAGSQVN